MFAPKQPLHRIAAGTESARKFQAKHQKSRTPVEESAEVKAWNAEIEAKKRAKRG